MEECQATFEYLKKYLGAPSLLSKPSIGEELCLYLAISPAIVSLVLVQEEIKVQKSIYYTSKILQDVETRYSKAEKDGLCPHYLGAVAPTIFPSPLYNHLR